MNGFTSKKIQLLIIVILTFLAYSNIFGNGYMTDDRDFVVNWKAKQDFSNFGEILKGVGPEVRGNVVYRPVRGIFYLIYHQLWGTNTFGYHLHAILVHIGITVLVYLIAYSFISSYSLKTNGRISVNSRMEANVKRMDANERMGYFLPFITALLFGLHPIHTEAITFMTSGIDMTGVLFMMASFWMFLLAKGERRKAKWLRIGSVVLAGLAFFTNEVTLVLPLLLILTELTVNGSRPSTRAQAHGLMVNRVRIHELLTINYKRILPYGILVVAYLVLRTNFVDNPFQSAFFEEGKFNYLQLLMPKILVKYLELLILPANLSIDHFFKPGIDSFSTVLYQWSGVTRQSFYDFGLAISISILGILAIAVWFLRKNRLIFFGIFWYLVALLPVANLFSQPTLAAERYLYLPSFGFVLILSYLLCELYANVKRINANARIFFFILTMLLALGYGTRTFVRNFDWRDEIKLWEAARDEYAQSPLVYYNLGNLNGAAGNFEAARENYLKVIEILPRFYNGYFNLATIYKKSGHEQMAEEMYKKITSRDPTVLEAYLNLADLYYKQGKLDLALSTLESSLEYEQKYIESEDKQMLGVISSIYGNIGVLYQLAFDWRQAIGNYKKALEINPENEFAKKGLGETEGKLEFQAITPPSRSGGINSYRAKAGYSFDYPGTWKIIETSEKVRLESGDFAVEIYIDQNRDGLSLDEYIDGLDTTNEGLVKGGFVDVGASPRVYARLFKRGNIAKSEFFLWKSGKIFKILVMPPTKETEELFDKIVETLSIS